MSGKGKKERAARIMMAVLEIAEAVREERADNAAQSHVDATALAGHLARELLDGGGSLEGGNAWRIKWPLDEKPHPIEDPLGYLGAIGVADLLLRALERARKIGPKATEAGSKCLRDAAEVWPSQPNMAAAKGACAKAGKVAADARAHAAAEAHAKRLATPTVKRELPKLHPAIKAADEKRFATPQDMWDMSSDVQVPGDMIPEGVG